MSLGEFLGISESYDHQRYTFILNRLLRACDLANDKSLMVANLSLPVETLNTSLIGRFRTNKDKQETNYLIALIGLMTFLSVGFDNLAIVQDFLLKLPSFYKMTFNLDHRRPFVSSFFLLGPDWIFQREQGVPTLVGRKQLQKANDYFVIIGPLEYLKSLVIKQKPLGLLPNRNQVSK